MPFVFPRALDFAGFQRQNDAFFIEASYLLRM
jgi:hypothetical protein